MADQYDVIVVGKGNAALCAAVSAHENGAKVLMLEAATDNPAGTKVAMLRRIASAGGVRFTESLVERAGPVVGPRVRRLLDTMGLEHVEAV